MFSFLRIRFPPLWSTLSHESRGTSRFRKTGSTQRWPRQWSQSLPPWLTEDLEWRRFGGLQVGLAGRRTLIALKLFAAADQSTRSVHAQDLAALAPSDTELEHAIAWVVTQDASPEFPRLVHEIAEHVRARRNR